MTVASGTRLGYWGWAASVLRLGDGEPLLVALRRVRARGRALRRAPGRVACGLVAPQLGPD